jgi:hypothetical protein
MRERGARYAVRPTPAESAGNIWSPLTEDIQQGVLDALEEHARAGRSVVVWRDGQIVELAGETLDGEVTRLRAQLRSTP